MMNRILLHAVLFSVLTGFVPNFALGQQTTSYLIDELEQELPPEAADLIREFNAESQQIRAKAENEIRLHRETAIIQLNRLQDEYHQDKKTDEAIAVRNKIRELRIAHLKPRPNPGNLSSLAHRIGQTFYFDVTGSQQGTVWGTDTYTADSALAAAAVHAGVLKVGQRGMVRVTIVKSPEKHEGSQRNGITTSDYGPYGASYKVRRPLASDTNANANETPSEPEILNQQKGVSILRDTF